MLVVDDETAWVGALGAVLGKAGHRIVAAYDGRGGAAPVPRPTPVDLVLLDLAMPGLDGAEVCRQIRAESDVPIIIVSGERDRSAPAELLDLGADDYFRKGVPADELLARMRAVARRRRRPAPARPAAAASDRGWELDQRRHEIRWRGRPCRPPPSSSACSRRWSSAPARSFRTTTCWPPAGPTCPTPIRCG